jgi:hypothetical protein
MNTRGVGAGGRVRHSVADARALDERLQGDAFQDEARLLVDADPHFLQTRSALAMVGVARTELRTLDRGDDVGEVIESGARASTYLPPTPRFDRTSPAPSPRADRSR